MCSSDDSKRDCDDERQDGGQRRSHIQRLSRSAHISRDQVEELEHGYQVSVPTQEEDHVPRTIDVSATRFHPSDVLLCVEDL